MSRYSNFKNIKIFEKLIIVATRNNFIIYFMHHWIYLVGRINLIYSGCMCDFYVMRYNSIYIYIYIYAILTWAALLMPGPVHWWHLRTGARLLDFLSWGWQGHLYTVWLICIFLLRNHYNPPLISVTDILCSSVFFILQHLAPYSKTGLMTVL